MSKRTVRRGKTTQKTDKQTTTIPTSAVQSSQRESQPVAPNVFELVEIENMKRAQLQKLCKQFGLKASGKVGTVLMSTTAYNHSKLA